MNEFGQLKKIPLREACSYDESYFTQWLASNIDLLNEVLHLNLELRQENLSSDVSFLLAQDKDNFDTVIIQNQIEHTGHTHFGELITHAATFNANKIIWIAESIQEKHKQALNWLNQNTQAKMQFTALSVEILQIDDSKPALHFIPAVLPENKRLNNIPTLPKLNEVTTAIITPPAETTKPIPTQQLPSVENEVMIEKPSKKNNLSKFAKYKAYFQALVDELREQYQFTTETKGRAQNWFSFPSDIDGIVYAATFANDSKVRAEICFDHEEKEKNKYLFDHLKLKEKSINEQCGAPLKWERLSEKRASRIAIYRNGEIDDSEEELEEIRQWHVEHLLKLKKVFDLEIQNHVKHLG